MNEVRLSGILQGVVEHSNNGQFITGSLEFSPEGHAILVIAAGANASQLDPFDTGDTVCISGRLTIFKDGFALLVNKCKSWAIAANPKKFSYDKRKAERTIRGLTDFPMGYRLQSWREEFSKFCPS